MSASVDARRISAKTDDAGATCRDKASFAINTKSYSIGVASSDCNICSILTRVLWMPVGTEF
jgi:hypothetical protein